MENSNCTICVVLVTYNRLQLLKECLNSILNNEKIAHIVVVNNNSTDGTREFLKTLNDDKFIIHHSKNNLGGAGGFALGIKLAYEKTSDRYFWIMDDDTIPNSTATHYLLQKAALLEDNFGFLCSNVRWKDNSPCNMPLPSFNWPEKIANGLVSVSQATFVSILITRKIVEEYGIPTQELFIWGDDTEYTTRITQKNSSYFVADSIVIHKTPNNLMNITVINDDSSRINRYKFLYRNLVYISKKYSSKRTTFKLVFSYFIFSISVLIKSKENRFSRFKAVFNGTFSGIFFNPPVSYVNPRK